MVMCTEKGRPCLTETITSSNFEQVKDCLFNLPKSSVSMKVKDGAAVVKKHGQACRPSA